MSILIYEKKDDIGRIIINRPEVRNAINSALVTKLNATLEEVANDDSVRVVIISAAGDKAFSAGFDLKESISSPIIKVPERREDTRFELDTWLKIWDMPKPVIAQVQGYCIGGGLHLALMCDLLIASDDAKFGEPEIQYSYIPDILIEPWKLPFNKARELLYLGGFISAKELYNLGVVNRIVPFEKLEEETLKIAKHLANMPQDTMKMLKYQVNKTYEIMGFKNSMDFAAEMFNLCRINQAQSESEFNEIVRTKGLKAALEWKEKQKQKND
jgi:enoyl-CoA hydratase